MWGEGVIGASGLRCLTGAVWLWFYRRFLRLRVGLRRIRWVAQFGGAWLGRVGGRRLCGAFESQTHGEGPAPPAGALQRGVVLGCVVGRRLLLVVAFVPDPSSLSSPGGNQPVLAVSSRITRCCGPAPSGRTPPGRAGCASTADSDEGSGTTPPVGRIPAPHACELTAACASRSGPRSHHRGGVLDPSSLSAGEAKLAGPVVSSRAFPHPSRCDPA